MGGNLNFKLQLKFFLIGGLLISQFNFAQDPIIFSNDKYSGISTVGLSPTQPFLNPNGWDVHVFSENIFFNNDYAYISGTSLLGLTKGDISGVNITRGITGENTDRVSDYFNEDYINYHLSSDFMGPSVSFKVNAFNKDFSVGLFSRHRIQGSAKDIGNYMMYKNKEIPEPVLYDLEPFETNFMNWAEIGLNLSTEVFSYSQYQWIVGVNLKYEMGLDAFYLKNNDNATLRSEYEPNPENPAEEIKSLYVSDFDLEVGYATNYNFDADRYEFNVQGKGIGIDVGIAMVNRLKNSDDYDFKMSLNALDIGYVNFNGNVHSFIGNDLEYINNEVFDEAEFENPEQFAQIISNEIYGDPNASHKSNAFTIGLPTSLHLNLSKNIGDNQFLNFDIIQRAPIFENSLKRANIANLSYSVQKPGIGYGASISTYEYENIQLGGFLRWGPLLIGSENIFPIFMKQKKLHSLDFFIGLKFYPIWDNEMTRRSRKECKC